MKLKKLSLILLCIVLTASLLISPVSAASYSDRLKELADIIRQTSLYSSEDDDPILRALESYFNENPEKFDEFVNYILQSYDPYSHYYSAEDYAAYYPVASEYVGIGVELDDTRKGGNFIKAVFDGSPAEEAGLLPGDEIVSVDGVDVTSYSISGLTSIIRGEADTEVVIGIRRDNKPAVIEYKITRKAITLSNIEFTDMGNGVAYIRILRFGDLKTFLDFTEIYRELPEKGFRSVIFDVRGNPGGALDVLLYILNYIIPDKDKEIMSIYSRDYGEESYYSTGIGWRADKLIVLTDQNSASAAEVFAGSLQALGYADVVGTKTYGKGIGQYHIELSDKSVVIVTNFEIKLPDQTSYDGKGITPDYIVEIGTAPYPMPRLGTLSHEKSLRTGDVSNDVLELEKRLQLLGYFSDDPDEVFDSRTLFAVQSFSRDFGLRVVSCASSNMIYHLNKEIERLSKTTVPVDTQLAKALELANKAIRP